MTVENQQTLARPSTHSLAIVSLVLSILGLMPVLPLIGSIAGLVTGIMARKEIKARPDLYTGEGTARAGIILGWIGIGLIVLACLAFALFFAASVITSSGSGTPLPPVITVQPLPIQP